MKKKLMILVLAAVFFFSGMVLGNTAKAGEKNLVDGEEVLRVVCAACFSAGRGMRDAAACRQCGLCGKK